MTRILLAECMQEVSSFNPLPGQYQDFVTCRGEELVQNRRHSIDEIGGCYTVFDRHDEVEVIPAMSAKSNTSTGTLSAESWNRLSSEWLDAIKNAGEIDGAYFALHGAMSAENESDPEGYLLEQARKILGESIPFVTSLDLHGILTERMIVHNNAVVVYHTYPHIDMFETGARAARVLMRMIKDNLKPVMALVKIPALVRGDELITETGSFGHCIRQAIEIEQSDSGISAGMFIGNPFTDVPELRTNAMVMTDQNPELASQLALQMADTFWEHHEKMQVPLTPLTDAARRACDQFQENPQGTVVLMDAADATSSGASGDSNAIVRALMETGYPGRVLSPVVDQAAVETAINAGIGATIDVTIGGQIDADRFTPLPVKARVKMLSDGEILSETFGLNWYAGKTAVLEAENYTYVVSSQSVSLFDRALFYGHGQDPKRFQAVVVKTPHAEPHMFADWCDQLINVDAPGSTSANLPYLGHTVCARPVFPLDENVTFTPKVQFFQRNGS